MAGPVCKRIVFHSEILYYFFFSDSFCETTRSRLMNCVGGGAPPWWSWPQNSKYSSLIYWIGVIRIIRVWHAGFKRYGKKTHEVNFFFFY